MSIETNTATTENREPTIPDDVLTDLRAAGCGPVFMRVIQTKPETVGVPKNSARAEILKYIRWAADSEKGVTDYLSYGGGFFQNLRTARTVRDARGGSPDPNNQQILDYVEGLVR